MNQNWNEDVPETGELTFAAIGRFFKTAWLRLLIYVVAALILVTAIYTPIKYIFRTGQAAVRIEFLYKGIEEGKTPKGDTFNAGVIKSPTVLTDAVTGANLDSKITDISELANHVSVIGVMPLEYYNLLADVANEVAGAEQKLRDTNFYPTKYNITINNYDKLGITKTESVNLVESIVDAYEAYFKNEYGGENWFDPEIFLIEQNASNDTTEYLDYYDQFNDTLTYMETILNTLKKEDINFISSNKRTFDYYLVQLGLLKSQYSDFNVYINTNKVAKDLSTVVSRLNDTLERLDNRIIATQDKIDSLNNIIKTMQETPNTQGGVDANGNPIYYIEYPQEYYSKFDDLKEQESLLTEYNLQEKEAKKRLDIFTDAGVPDPTEAELAETEKKLNAIRTASHTLAVAANEMVAEYYDRTIIQKSMRTVVPSSFQYEEFGLSMIIIYAITVVLAVLIACIETGIRMRKATLKRIANNPRPTAPPASPVAAEQAAAMNQRYYEQGNPQGYGAAPFNYGYPQYPPQGYPQGYPQQQPQQQAQPQPQPQSAPAEQNKTDENK